MPFGYMKQARVFIGDTSLLTAYLYQGESDELVPQADISEVRFTVLKPTDSPAAPSVNNVAGSIVAPGEAHYLVPGTINTEGGNYKGRAVFSFTEDGFSKISTVPIEYMVTDPFESAGVTPLDPTIDLAWAMLEDCFDSEQGGPWLRDMTMAYFDKDKMKRFVPDVLMEFNALMPQTTWTQADFPYQGDGSPILAQGLLVATIRHLMRSYTEQPTPQNSPVAHYSREDYQQRWSVIYQVELERWNRLAALFKASQYDMGHAAVLIGSKAGRLMPASFRTRGMGRGYGW